MDGGRAREAQTHNCWGAGVGTISATLGRGETVVLNGTEPRGREGRGDAGPSRAVPASQTATALAGRRSPRIFALKHRDIFIAGGRCIWPCRNIRNRPQSSVSSVYVNMGIRAPDVNASLLHVTAPRLSDFAAVRASKQICGTNSLLGSSPEIVSLFFKVLTFLRRRGWEWARLLRGAVSRASGLHCGGGRGQGRPGQTGRSSDTGRVPGGPRLCSRPRTVPCHVDTIP